MQHSSSCSHYSAFCSSTCTLMQPLQCDLHPRAAEHQRFSRNDHSRNRRTQTHELPFYRRPQPLHTEKHKVSFSGFLPKTNPMQQSCSHYNAFWSSTCQTRMSRHTWQQNATTIMQPFHCDLQAHPSSPLHHPSSSPLPFGTTSLSHHPCHHFPQSPPFVYVMYC